MEATIIFPITIQRQEVGPSLRACLTRFGAHNQWCTKMRASTACGRLFLAGLNVVHVSARERTTVELKTGEGVSCSELAAPRRWTVPGYDPSRVSVQRLSSDGFWLNEQAFEFRQQGGRLLMGVVAQATLMPERAKSQLYSPDVYAVIHGKRNPVLERASQDEWSAARVLPQSREHALRSIGVLEDGKPLEFAGHTFVPS